jgi:hypothetical protein
MPMETKKFTTLPGCPGWRSWLLTRPCMSLDAASCCSILK